MSRRRDRVMLLERLYGRRAGEIADEVERLIAGHRGRRKPGGPRWDERDTWLISYPDQFQAEGEAPLRTLDRFMSRHLALLNGVHVLPCYPWSSDDGFSVEDYLAIDPRYGTWADVERIAESRRLMLDAVINHMSVGSEWFRRFLAGEPGYERLFRTADPRADLSAVVRPRTTPLLTPFEAADGTTVWVWTTFSADQADLDYREPSTALRILDVLLSYAAHGASAIRLDAVGFLWKEEGTPSIHLPQTHDLIRWFRACLDDTYPHVLLVTETNVPHEENVSYFGDGSMPEAQIVYQFALAPLTLHAVATGEVEPLRRWASGLEVPRGGTFLNFLASHDGVGLRPAEGWLDGADVARLVELARSAGGAVGMRSSAEGTQVPYELNSTWFDLVAAGYDERTAVSRHLATHAVMLAMPGIPAVYVHSLFGTSNDHDAYRRSGVARRLNRRRFTDVTRLEETLSTPHSRAHRVLAGIGDMLRVRAASEAFHPDAPLTVLDAPAGVLALERGGDRRVRVYVNLGSGPATVEVPGEVLLGQLDGGRIPPFSSLWVAL